MVNDLAAFLGVSALVIVTPGQDTVLTIRNTLLGGWRGGAFTALGVSTGQAVMTLLWLTAYAIAVAKAGDVLRRPAVRHALDAVTGTVLVALGLRLAIERR